jgi:hypothetical protein
MSRFDRCRGPCSIRPRNLSLLSSTSHEVHLHFPLALRLHFAPGVKWNSPGTCPGPARSRTNAYVLSLIFTCLASSHDPVQLAMFTVSPRTFQANFFTPTMPATTGPVSTPMRILEQRRPFSDLSSCDRLCPSCRPRWSHISNTSANSPSSQLHYPACTSSATTASS